jgi:hypothetical protein
LNTHHTATKPVPRLLTIDLKQHVSWAMREG